MTKDKNELSITLKALRKQYSMTQEELSIKTGVGLNFIRQLEQGKATVRLDKVSQVFALFGYHIVAVKNE